MKKSLWKKVFAVLLLIFIAIQFISYGRDHNNPPVTNSVDWGSPQTKETFYTACADCHSNETNWPWYSNIAPASWLVQSDIEEGREHFNISTMEGMDEAKEAYEMVEKGAMPLDVYLILHRDADLAEEQKASFVEGLKATFNKSQSEPIEDSHAEKEN